MGTRERRERERKMRKNQILSAARELLAENGIAGTSMNQIAERAELSVGTLYIYFKNKEDLYASLQEEGLDLLYDSITKAVEKGGTPLDKLRQIARTYLKFSEKEKNYFEIINYFLTTPEIVFPQELKERIDAHGNKIVRLVEDILKKNTISTYAPEKELRRHAIVFWSSLHGLLQFRKLESTILKGMSFLDIYLYCAEIVLESFKAKT